MNDKKLLLILLFALVVRLYRIGYPQAYIFDEVYHGFTAQEIAKGNKMAWEWWNTPPKGFAYEWTHPALAKVIMAGSIKLFGANNQTSQYAFRLPAVFFGVGVVYLIYLLGKQLFNEKVGLLAAFFTTFDNLNFTMSRVGMIDIYFLFFLLATIFFTLRKKYFWSAVFLGLAVSTKWTAFYIFPVVGLILSIQFVQQMKIKKSLITQFLNYSIPKLILFIFIPPLVYLLSHFLFFTSGHTFKQFWELQKQMWWYHTNLKATHGYQSQAWSWPLMLRPVWFWVSYQQTKIGNIYNLGNPFLWWSGLLILPFVIWQAVKAIFQKKNYRLGLVTFCYFIFWLPWIVSPRIMFLHHYLPALPFLFILIAYLLNKIEKCLPAEASAQAGKLKIKNWKIKGSQILICYLILTFISFCLIYPLNTGIMLPKNSLKYFFWLPSWR